MGLLFDNFENKFVVRGRKQGQKQGEKQANARWSAWMTDNPEIKKLIDKARLQPLQSPTTTGNSCKFPSPSTGEG